MIRVNVICEGPTEEQFVRKVLYPYFIAKGITLSASSLGGGFSYESLKYHIVEFLNSDQGAYVTTLVDVYGMNNDYPGYEANKTREALDKVQAIEEAVEQDVLSARNLHNRKFIPHFQLHEFEALLFSDPEVMQEWLSLDRRIPANAFSEILTDFDSPEHINDSPQTAPSKRIEAVVPSYEKIDEGVSIADEIGLEKMREECIHFDAWLTKLENLAPNPTPPTNG